MKSREIRHGRIIQLRSMALRGCSLEQLTSKCVSWNISKGTTNNYIEEVRESLQKIVDKKKGEGENAEK